MRILRGSIVGAVTAFVGIVVACGGDGASIPASGGDAQAGPDGTSGDGGPITDAPTGSDSPSAIDANSAFDAAACTGLTGREVTACEKATDCDIVYRGCYCGQQPAVGVATAFSVLVASCEQKAGQECALGCAQAPGHIAQDGKSDLDGGTVHVRCDSSGAGKGTCKTYVP